MQTIYIDVLLCVNLVINYLLLSAASFYTHTNVKVGRLLWGSAVGALCSLTILLPAVPFFADMAIKSAAGGITVFSAFGRKKLSEFLRLYAVFLIATFFFGGIIIALWFVFTPRDLIIKNSVIYFNISPLMLIFYSVICYCAFRLFNSIAGKHQVRKMYCKLTVRNNNEEINITAKVDTGNSLKEPFSQCPVVVVGRKTAEIITPAEIIEYETVTTLKYRSEIKGIRFVPFTSVGGSGILPSFKADEIYIDGELCDKTVYIALCSDNYISGNFQAIIPVDIIETKKGRLR